MRICDCQGQGVCRCESFSRVPQENGRTPDPRCSRQSLNREAPQEDQRCFGRASGTRGCNTRAATGSKRKLRNANPSASQIAAYMRDDDGDSKALPDSRCL